MIESFRRHLSNGEVAGARYTLAAPRNVASGAAGFQLGRQIGSSIDFQDYREYQPGDDLRHIDWSAYGRSDKLFVKLYREEVDPHLDLLLDCSRSMAIGSGAHAEGRSTREAASDKARAALGLAAALVAAAGNSGYTHTAWATGEGCRTILHGDERPTAWDGIAFDQRTSPAAALGTLSPAWRARGIRILVSDLLWMEDPATALDRLTHGAAATHLVQVLARDDVEPDLRGSHRLVDSETDEVHEVFVDATAQELYRDRLTRHQESWNNAARRFGAALTTVVAEDVVESWDLGELIAAEILAVV